MPADFQWACRIFAACATYSRRESQIGFPLESHGDGNNWAKVLGIGMGMGVGISQREWEGILFFFVKLLNLQTLFKYGLMY